MFRFFIARFEVNFKVKNAIDPGLKFMRLVWWLFVKQVRHAKKVFSQYHTGKIQIIRYVS